MSTHFDQSSQVFLPGVRVRICNDTLQAFYGDAGTIIKVRCCPRSGLVTHVDVRMDELPSDEAEVVFYPYDLAPLPNS